MEIKKLECELSICKVKDVKQVNFNDELYFIGKTDEELSLVCTTACVPNETIDRVDGWKAFRIQGVLDFSLIGILSKISTLLAEKEIGIFVVSTFNTDYVLTKADAYDKALQILANNGYIIV